VTAAVSVDRGSDRPRNAPAAPANAPSSPYEHTAVGTFEIGPFSNESKGHSYVIHCRGGVYPLPFFGCSGTNPREDCFKRLGHCPKVRTRSACRANSSPKLLPFSASSRLCVSLCAPLCSLSLCGEKYRCPAASFSQSRGRTVGDATRQPERPLPPSREPGLYPRRLHPGGPRPAEPNHRDHHPWPSRRP